MRNRSAQLAGIAAATHLHRELGLYEYIKEGLEQVDVFGTLRDLSIPTLCRPLDGLLGAYFCSPEHGVLISTKRRLPIQRLTAAHELGHCQMKHADSLDTEVSMKQAFEQVGGVDEQEVEAEAFASEFLLPKRLVVNIAKKRGWNKSDLTIPYTVYQLALRAGISYSAMCRGLVGHNLIDIKAYQALLRVAPGAIKRELLCGIPMIDTSSDVFYITDIDDGLSIAASPDDLVVIELLEHHGKGCFWSGIDETKNLKVHSNQARINSAAKRDISYRAYVISGENRTQIRLSEQMKTDNASALLRTFSVDIAFLGKEAGLPRLHRQIGD